MSSNKDKMERRKQNPKIIFQLLLSIPSKKKTTEVENKISGIIITPAPFGLGVLWLLLVVGISRNISFCRNFNAHFNNTEVSGYKAKIIIKLIIN
tara:strand:- start:183 stop:467 length:285 start_codon:yes stop_codon:yes gene_type:complete